MYEELGISEKVVKVAEEVEKEVVDIFAKLDVNCMKASSKVLKAFQDNKVATTDFIEVTGYGYYDGGREKLEKVYSQIFGAEDALVRPQIMSGTHALSLTLFGLLKYGDTMISISGEPYDTLKSVIGLAGDSENSLIKHGIKYEEIDLVNNDFDYEKIAERIKQGGVKLVEIQRSRGYSQRKSLTISKIEKVVKTIKDIDSSVIEQYKPMFDLLNDSLEVKQLKAKLKEKAKQEKIKAEKELHELLNQYNYLNLAQFAYDIYHAKIVFDDYKTDREMSARVKKILNPNNELSFVWIDEDENIVKSSKNIRMPMDIVRTGLKLWKHNKVKHGYKVDCYTVLEVRKDYVQIGCHKIPIENIKALYEKIFSNKSEKIEALQVA